MANPDQVAMLRRSVQEWYLWREAHRTAVLDLRGADLHGSNLSSASPRGPDQTFPHLHGADLRGTDNTRLTELRRS